jgi:transposase
MDHFIGVDIHRKFIQICVLDADGHREQELSLQMSNSMGIEEFFGAFAPGTRLALEATCGWMWLTDLVESLGLEVHPVHMLAMRVIAESRCKTDKIDAYLLAEMLRINHLPEAYLAPPAVRDLRMVLRHREGMVCWRTSAKNKAHAVLTRHNIHLAMTDIFSARGMEMLRELELRPTSRRVMDDLLEMIEFLQEQIARIEKRLYKHLPADGRVAWLRSLPGVGKLTAYFIVAEVGRIDRFLSPARFVSYCGLCSSTRQSAAHVRHGSTKGSGRRLLKWALVEAAHTAARRDEYFARVFHRTARRRGTGRAYVAVARKMAQVIWHMLTEGRPYRTSGMPPRVGSSRAVTAGN